MAFQKGDLVHFDINNFPGQPDGLPPFGNPFKGIVERIDDDGAVVVKGRNAVIQVSSWRLAAAQVTLIAPREG